MDEVEPEFTIENMTLTARLDKEVDLDEVAASYRRATFNPEKFMRVDFRLRDPKATIGIFRSGKLVCLGTKSFEDGKRAIHRLVELFQDHSNLAPIGLKLKPQLKNVVAQVRTGLFLDLDSLSSHFEGSNYDPRQFSGLLVRMYGGATATLYSTGNIMFMGVESVERMREFVNVLVQKVRSLSAGANIVGGEQN